MGRNTCELGSSCCREWGWCWQTWYPLGLPYKTPENLIHCHSEEWGPSRLGVLPQRSKREGQEAVAMSQE